MTNGNGAPVEQAAPQLNVLAQYTKDLSFENPNAPASLGQQQQQPAINIQINVGANNLSENEYEVILSIEGKAETGGKVMFSFDLAYAGVFRIVNVPKENLHPLVMIECPRLLFPFAREIVATSAAGSCDGTKVMPPASSSPSSGAATGMPTSKVIVAPGMRWCSEKAGPAISMPCSARAGTRAAKVSSKIAGIPSGATSLARRTTVGTCGLER